MRRITHYTLSTLFAVIAGGIWGMLHGFTGPLPADPNWVGVATLYILPACPAFISFAHALMGAGALEA